MHKKQVSTPKWIKNVLPLKLVYEALGIIITFCFFFWDKLLLCSPTWPWTYGCPRVLGLYARTTPPGKNRLKYWLDVVAYAYLPRYSGGGKRITWYWEFKASLDNTVGTSSQRQQINRERERCSSVVEGLPSVRSVVRRAVSDSTGFLWEKTRGGRVSTVKSQSP